jgi:hypothetical protein
VLAGTGEGNLPAAPAGDEIRFESFTIKGQDASFIFRIAKFATEYTATSNRADKAER